MQLGKIQIAILALVITNIIWGAAFPIYKWSLDNIPPFTFAFLRFYIGALIILPFVIKDLKIRREDWTKQVVLALVSVTIQIPLLFLGLQLSPSINAPIIIASGPIFLIIASFFFLHEKIKLKVLLGTLISLFGVVLVIIRPLLENGFSGGVLGNLFIILATFCAVAQTILLRKITPNNNPLTVTFWMFLIGAIPLIPFTFWEATSFNIWNDLNIKGSVGLIYGIILAAVIAHIFLAFATKLIKASEIGIFSYVDPIATVAVAIPLLNETVTSVYLLAGALVFLGIFIAQGRIPYHPFRRLFSG